MRIVTSSADGTARLWNATTGAEIAVLRDHEGAVETAVFNPAGASVLTVLDNYAAEIWDAKTGTKLSVLRGHEEWINSIVFDTAGGRVLTASADGTARLWDVATGGGLAVIGAGTHEYRSAVFDGAGTRVLTASYRTAEIWRVFPTVAELIANARAIMPRGLTAKQRSQFFLN
jgi:WD40 repeat protein